MKLYKITLKGLQEMSINTGIINGVGYVLSDNSNDAYNKMKNYIELKELARSRKDLALDKIELIAEENEADCGFRLFL